VRRNPHLTPRRSRSAAALALAFAVSAPLLSLPATHADEVTTVGVDKLGDHDRELLKEYAAKARSRSGGLDASGQFVPYPDHATLILAVRPASTLDTATQIERLGGQIVTTEERVGLVTANVPFGAVDAVVALGDVLRVDVDELHELVDVTPDGSDAVTAQVQAATSGQELPDAPSASTPDANPYMPTEDLGSASFKAKNSTYDGRGITIGIMDTGIDPTHPALATTTTGEDKLVDTVVGSNPVTIIDLFTDRTWILVSANDLATEPVESRQGIDWTMPEGGGEDMYLKTRLYSAFGPADPTLTGWQGIAMRSSDQAIWVDTNEDRVFSDDELIRPFAEDRQIGYIGTDDPTTELNEREPFTVEWKQLTSGLVGLNINTLDVGHGTHVAGITAANGMFDGQMDGQAPGAKLVSMRACTSFGCSSHALTTGMTALALDYDVDVINMSIGSSPALNDGQSAMALLYDRLIEESGVQIFVSAGNSGAGNNTVGDPSTASKVVSVGASVTKDTWWANYGSAVTPQEDIMPFSSRGPREDGGLKPDLVAPGSAISTVPSWLDWGAVGETGYQLPAGYSMLNGTSMSSPQAAGAAALLLSAAEQRGVSATPEDLRTAIFSTADRITEGEAVDQGRGKLNVAEAWKALTKGVSDTEHIEVSAPVCTVLAGDLGTPHTGIGLYNSCAPSAGGQTVGEERTYEITLTRTTGEDRAHPYQVRIPDNDGTFQATTMVKLAKDVPTTVEVTATPSSAGMHSALLTIDDARTWGVEGSVMLAIEAADELDFDGTWSATGTVERNDTVTYSIAVPEGTSSLTVNLAGLDQDSQTRWWAFQPTGVEGESSRAGTAYCYANYLDGNGCDPYSRTYASPTPGVWELVVEARRTSPLLDNPFTVEATVTP